MGQSCLLDINFHLSEMSHRVRNRWVGKYGQVFVDRLTTEASGDANPEEEERRRAERAKRFAPRVASFEARPVEH